MFLPDLSNVSKLFVSSLIFPKDVYSSSNDSNRENPKMVTIISKKYLVARRARKVRFTDRNGEFVYVGLDFIGSEFESETD